MSDEPNNSKKLHIAMIMDGNRRYAVKKGLLKVKGHEFGAKTFEDIVQELVDNDDLSEFTFYAFSVQNFNRSQKEVDYLMNLSRKFFKKMISKFDEQKICVRFLGRLDLFPQDIQDLCFEVEEKTASYTEKRINFCHGYGGREEIVDAAKQIAKEVQEGNISPDDISEDLFSRYLYFNHEPDIVIRTGGDFRTSNFLPWQTIYSEWFFLKELWPEFTVEKLREVVVDFQNRERRFGK